MIIFYFFKGNANIVNLFLLREANVHACDINDHTPLHEAARWSDSSDEENKDRINCIDYLVGADAEVNALNIHRESPLHIACRYGSSFLVKSLLNHGADLLKTNIHGFNCLEVAIEEKNEETVT
jgi:ankyrin repeat protein